MTKRMYARLKADGKYHYGLSSTVGVDAGPLFEISVQGIGPEPVSPRGTASRVEHERWIASLRVLDCAVGVAEVLEPNSARV
jgi:hypothetical protein